MMTLTNLNQKMNQIAISAMVDPPVPNRAQQLWVKVFNPANLLAFKIMGYCVKPFIPKLGKAFLSDDVEQAYLQTEGKRCYPPMSLRDFFHNGSMMRMFAANMYRIGREAASQQ